MAGTCSLYYNNGSEERLETVPADRRYPQQATSRHLVDLILGDTQVNRSSGEIGARTVELLDAAYRSAAERRIVSIDEL
jgi:predicted dehydrogenase